MHAFMSIDNMPKWNEKTERCWPSLNIDAPWTRFGKRCLLVLDTLGTLKMLNEFQCAMDVEIKYQIIYY